ncbi:FAD-dependent oxidoreductase [Halotia wernerae UHCC 0503]|nr:FAD-dependent oxidoreductase [Halotia wernerae UHCC 0503]
MSINSTHTSTVEAEVTTNHQPTESSNTNRKILDIQQTTCCIVGGGPAGAVLALLLARKGISVMLLEAHKDFDRYFRGDTIHSSVLELMDELGLADRLLQIRHTKTYKYITQTSDGPVTFADFSRLKSKFPFMMIMEQVRFLEFIMTEAKQYPNFQLVMGANVQELIEEDGVIRGVRYRGQGGWHEVRADLTVGADGRFSRTRHLAGLNLKKHETPIDVLWFRLPRKPDEPEEELGEFGQGCLLVLTNRFEYWQVGYIIPKGQYQQIHASGLEALRQSVAETMPMLADRVAHLKDWKQVALLPVVSGLVERWHRPGLLLIGDAAHVMSPIGGVGINYAIQDAVVTANVLSTPLAKKQLQQRHLAAVQRQRELPTRIIQWFQSLSHEQVIVKTFKSGKQFKPPKIMLLPLMRDLPAALMGYGVWPVHIKN